MQKFVLALVLIAISGMTACQTTTGKTAFQTMTDASVTAAVQRKLTADRTSNFARVDVDTDQGIVQLSGVVQTLEQKARAEELAKRVKGVIRIDNHLQIQTAKK